MRVTAWPDVCDDALYRGLAERLAIGGRRSPRHGSKRRAEGVLSAPLQGTEGAFEERCGAGVGDQSRHRADDVRTLAELGPVEA